MVVVVKENKDGKIELTKKELEAMLEQARLDGVKEASEKNIIINTPAPYTTPQPTKFWWTEVTCMSEAEQDILATASRYGSGDIDNVCKYR